MKRQIFVAFFQAIFFPNRLVSSEDVGRDEAQVQSMLKKHKDVTDELKNYANVIQQLKQQVRG